MREFRTRPRVKNKSFAIGIAACTRRGIDVFVPRGLTSNKRMSSGARIRAVNRNYGDPAATNAIRMARRAVKDNRADNGGLIDAPGRSPAHRGDAGEIAVDSNVIDEGDVVLGCI